MEVEWFCQMMGSEVGPLTQVQLIDMVRKHKINPEDLVKRNNSPWVAAFEVKGLFAAAAKTVQSKPAVSSPEDPVPESKPDVDAAKRPTAPAESVIAPRKIPARPTSTLAHEVGKADWYCIASGEKKGPLGFVELQALFKDGQLRQTDRVWRSSAPKFCKASEIEGLRDH